jgi:hypothetical protein
LLACEISDKSQGTKRGKPPLVCKVSDKPPLACKAGQKPIPCKTSQTAITAQQVPFYATATAGS